MTALTRGLLDFKVPYKISGLKYDVYLWCIAKPPHKMRELVTSENGGVWGVQKIYE